VFPGVLLLAKRQEWPALPAAVAGMPHEFYCPRCNVSTQLDVLNQWINILQSVQLPFAVIPVSPG